MRRYDIDAIRIIALSLLIFYHIMVAFQPWGDKLYFITNKDSLESIWVLMELINIWRIPILFMVSGMGVQLAMQNRTWGALLGDRTLRIAVPLIFGSIFIVPSYIALFFIYYDKPVPAIPPSPGHLWFLLNIFLYVVFFLPLLIYLTKNPGNIIYLLVIRLIGFPFGIIAALTVPVIFEAVLINPRGYAGFALEPLHGWTIGMVYFLSGFILVSLKDVFWDAVRNIKVTTLAVALMLYCLRVAPVDLVEVLGSRTDNALQAFEAACWILASFGFACSYLNRPYKILLYLTAAVYPVYIVHMPLQYLFASVIFPLNMPAILKLAILFVATCSAGLLVYELLRRLKWIRLLFGMKV